MRHQLTFLCLVAALLVGAHAADGAQARTRPEPDLYFSECREEPGSVLRAGGAQAALYTWPSGRIWSFTFAPWDPDLLYFVGANSAEIIQVDLETGTEVVVHTHTTTVKDLAFDATGTLFFSDGGGAIRRLEPTGEVPIWFRAPREMLVRSEPEYWTGDFGFTPDGQLLLGTGTSRTETGGAFTGPRGFVFQADPLAIVTDLYSSPDWRFRSLAHNAAGTLHIIGWPATLFTLDLAAGTLTESYDFGPDTQVCDIAFRPSASPPPEIPGTWVMPYGLSAFRVDQIKSTGLSTGLVDYANIVDAPFGGQLSFRFDSSNVVPVAPAFYYRLSYRPENSTVWTDFDAPVLVHYVKNRPGKTPVFPLVKLGPEEFDGVALYRFRPHEEDLPEFVDLPPGIPEWPKNGFPGDAIRGRLDTVGLGLAPGKYEIRYEVYDELGAKSPAGAGYQMIVPVGVDAQGGLVTAPATVVDGGFQFTLHVDNRPTEAEIAAPAVSGAEADDCGFLRYIERDPGEVRFAWRAWHPGHHATYSLAVTKGAQALTSLPVAGGTVDLPNGEEVTSTAHNGQDGAFMLKSPTRKLLEPCAEAAFAVRLHVRAKAVNGNGTRLQQYDSKVLRAFAIAPK